MIHPQFGITILSHVCRAPIPSLRTSRENHSAAVNTGSKVTARSPKTLRRNTNMQWESFLDIFSWDSHSHKFGTVSIQSVFFEGIRHSCKPGWFISPTQPFLHADSSDPLQVALVPSLTFVSMFTHTLNFCITHMHIHTPQPKRGHTLQMRHLHHAQLWQHFHTF